MSNGERLRCAAGAFLMLQDARQQLHDADKNAANCRQSGMRLRLAAGLLPSPAPKASGAWPLRAPEVFFPFCEGDRTVGSKPVRRYAFAVAIAAVLGSAIPAQAMAMDVATFLGKAEELRRKGPAAPFSRDFKLIKGEIARVTDQLEQQRAAALAAGEAPPYCPSRRPKLTREELLAALHAVPAAIRSQVEIGAAFRSAFSRKYPCSSPE